MPARVLVSYSYLCDNPAALQTTKLGVEKHAAQLLLDSGAFTAWKAGKKIDLDDYCRFIERVPFPVWKYFTLDVIGDGAATLANYRTMLQRGFRPIPIFTRGEGVEVLEEYYATSDLVGIGGLVGTLGNKGFVKGIMREVRGRKCHWLGFTNGAFILQYLPFSVDSSSWLSGARYGQASLYLGRGKFRQITRRDFWERPGREVGEALARLGVSPLELKREEAWRGSGSVASVVTSRSFAKYSEDLFGRFGVSFFLATKPGDLNQALHSFSFVEGKAG